MRCMSVGCLASLVLSCVITSFYCNCLAVRELKKKKKDIISLWYSVSACKFLIFHYLKRETAIGMDFSFGKGIA